MVNFKEYFTWQMISVIYVFCVKCSQSWPYLPNFDIWNDSKTNFSASNEEEFQRQPKVLNFFSLPIEYECPSTDGRRKGICLNTYECRIQGGKSFGPCALGFGVCCVFTESCGGQVLNNNTYFQNPSFPDLSHNISKCELQVEKIDPKITQFRLDFVHFQLGQPNRRTGVCDDDVFIMSGKNIRQLRLCGLNSGQHVYIDVDNLKDTLSLIVNPGKRNVGRMWEVLISQIPFRQRAPNGCLQYHTGTKGLIQTMNFAENGRRLADQDYAICIRQEEGMCSIAYEPCDDNSFKIGNSGGGNNTSSSTGAQNSGTMSDNMDAANEETGSGERALDDRMCNDRITLPCDNEDFIMPSMSNMAVCDLVHCGTSFCPNGETICRVESTVTPFTVGVQFGPGSRDESPDDNLGMCLHYEQLACAV